MTDLKKIAYIALGANLSNPKENFQKALQTLQIRGVSTVAASSLWHSPAWPAGQGCPDYVNAVVKVRTSMQAQALLDCLHEIEENAGRRRTIQNAPRPLDLDIVDFNGEHCALSPLLPHPRMLLRPFVLLPLLEISIDWRHPVIVVSALEALAKLPSKDVLSHRVIERKWMDSPTCV